MRPNVRIDAGPGGAYNGRMVAEGQSKDRRSVKITNEDAQALRALALALGFENPRQFGVGNTSEMLRSLAKCYRAEPDRVASLLQDALRIRASEGR